MANVIGPDLDLVGRVTAIESPQKRQTYVPEGYALYIKTLDEARERVFLPDELVDAFAQDHSPESLPGKLVHYSRWGTENHKLEILDSRVPAETYTAGPEYQGAFERLYDWTFKKLTMKAPDRIKA